ncbi:MAG TPA: 30S ribosomal protein S5, partial [Nitrososphaeraceae archaeon]|nr:30S ribosomal protein S5 [Nitrososphaeraceae archaeon]
KGGSVTIEVLPGPRGLGLVAGENIKTLLKLAGLKDAWTKSYGSTNTMASTTKAIFNALRSTFAAG